MNHSINEQNNRKVARGFANYVSWGAVLVLATCGLAAIFSGSDLDAVQKVIQAEKVNWPLHIHMPDTPMGPTQLNQSSQPDIYPETLSPSEQWKRNLRP